MARGIDGNRRLALDDLRGRLVSGREHVRAYFENGGQPDRVYTELSAQMDALIQGLADFAHRYHYGPANPTLGEEMSIVAVGGFGRGELAPMSDVDLLFLTDYKRAPYVEQLAEFILYKLWDLNLKVGQSIRTVDECIRYARDDLTIRTTLLERRLLWGSRALCDRLDERYRREIVHGREGAFIEAKLAERDTRHRRTGDSRYLLEPNIKEGKGGLRDLHTLMWIGRFVYGATEPAALVDHGVLTPPALRSFLSSRRFLWALRAHLHYITGRAEERLAFDLQPEVAERMGFRDRGRTIGVERFMKRYYLVAKEVGSLTRIVCASLEEQHVRRPRLGTRLGFGRRRINGFVIQNNRVSLGEPDLFETRPLAIMEIFRLAQDRQLDIHPAALGAVRQSLRQVDGLRDDPAASRMFLDVLCARQRPATMLACMNETGVLGRFIPEFGRVVAQMQHNLYHFYTVDEHTIRAVDNVMRIEGGEVADALPLATELMPKVSAREELFLAVFAHDMGKGRGGDHSEIGSGIAERLARRLGFIESSIELVAWLVRHHLVMSTFAFRRDPEDAKTIQDFVSIVQTPERLRMLLILTAADIRAVGPGVWNGWKGQLLRELYHEAAAAMATSDAAVRRAERGEEQREALANALAADRAPPWTEEQLRDHLARHEDRYWLGFPLDDLVRHARLMREADSGGQALTLDFRVDPFRDRSELTLYAPDHPGLFMKIAGALALSGVNIVDAHIFTTRDGMALDIFGCQDAETSSIVDGAERLARINRNLQRALSGEVALDKELAGRRSLPSRADVFTVEPRVHVDNSASRTHTVIEVDGRDRPGLLFSLARALKDQGLVISSAHISTYGERVVDVFYVKDVFGMKITRPAKLQRLEKQLKEAIVAT